ncbi:MAG: YcjX family protein [Paracoccaceae bacterium]|nr:YcjX family protein [Paracoccaceae bacterium]MDG1738560.1 YcjX family protein [Paracoccaceae bacterium]MDG2260186.1 YcjX family protein [Paracoccaceae bacterium]
MALSNIVKDAGRQVSALGDSVNEALFEPVIRLGVTGLARSGKTVFITSLVANLLDRGRMPGLRGAELIKAGFLKPQPDDTVPRFDYEAHLEAMTGAEPEWPESTRSISELRLSFRVDPTGFLGGFQGPRTVHVDIVDYPGEWLLDLLLLGKGFDEWSAETIAKMENRAEAGGFLTFYAETDGSQPHDEAIAQKMAKSLSAYLNATREAGWSDCTPGRFLLPSDLDGSPVLTFAPVQGEPKRGTLRREMERRYEAYKSKVVRPFFRDHFAKLDRQVVLVDVLGAMNRGRPAVRELRDTMTGLMEAFRPGRNRFLARLLGGRRVEKILFAATKVDHLHHKQHPDLTAFMENLVRQSRDRADFAGAQTAAMSLASLRVTIETQLKREQGVLDCVQGRVADKSGAVAFHPGTVPKSLTEVLEAEGRFGLKDITFQPAPLTLLPGQGPPHIRLDRAADFLIGDVFK